MTIPFRYEYPFEYARIEEVSPLVRRVVARNASAFTFHGTATFIIGRGEVAIIDPGPLVEEHINAIATALSTETITHLVVTHTHRDHSPACRPLQKLCGAPIYGFGPHGSGRVQSSVLGPADDAVEEGGDMAFTPDEILVDGDELQGPGWTLTALHTPGHTSNHLCFSLKEENTLFTGDHVMGWSTTVIVPPDGDMGRYLASLRLLLDRKDDALYRPTHGPQIDNPHGFVRGLLRHRELRLDQIRRQLGQKPGTIENLLGAMYPDLATELLPAAARSCLAGMIYLIEQGEVECDAEYARLDGLYRVSS